MLAAFGSHPVLYDVLVAAHVTSALVGFGTVAMSGVYGATARRAGRPREAEEVRRYFRSAGRAEWLLLAVPFLGAAALAVRPGPSSFGDLWVGAAATVWLVAALLLLGAVRPAERAIRAALDAGDQEKVARSGRRLALAAGASDVLFVVALGFMIFQPV